MRPNINRPASKSSGAKSRSSSLAAHTHIGTICERATDFISRSSDIESAESIASQQERILALVVCLRASSGPNHSRDRDRGRISAGELVAPVSLSGLLLLVASCGFTIDL